MTKSQLKVLKSLSQSPSISLKDKDDNFLATCQYLESLGYVKITHKTNTAFTSLQGFVDLKGLPLSAAITESGKAYLSDLKTESRKLWIPYIITTLISILALMKSYGYGIDDIFTWCMQQLTQLWK